MEGAHWNGISLYGAKNSRNTVADLNNVSPGPPWAGFFNHKNGTLSSNCILRNNLAQSFQIGAGAAADHNYKITGYAAYPDMFVDYLNFNLRLKAGAAPINAGSFDLVPAIDREGRSRPQGSAVDMGAYGYYPQEIFSHFGPGFYGIYILKEKI